MLRRWLFGILALALVGGLVRPAVADLDEYIRRPEPRYKWEKRGQEKRDGVTIYDLYLVSQEWQGHVWEHRLQVFRPDKVDYPNFCTLYNTGGGGSADNTAMGITLAKSTRATYAILFGIPKQPLYGGKTEDALINYTWLKFIETGDESWPLHFPMAKSCIKAMDAIQAFATSEKLPALNDFVITGASKRGWTTWLAGATRDPRIKGIAPMVIDCLNLTEHLKYQIAYYGENGSEQIADYARSGMLKGLDSPRGKRLVQLEDPYAYRDRLTLPKLIILGTNDPYWPQDALNLYWDGLRGQKHVIYAPNSGHGLNDRTRVFNTLSAFCRVIATRRRMPRITWNYAKTPDGVTLSINSDIKPRSARIFSAEAKTLDFRGSKWSSREIEPVKLGGSLGRMLGGGYSEKIAKPAIGKLAVYGEVSYEIDGEPYTLTTQINILPEGVKK